MSLRSTPPSLSRLPSAMLSIDSGNQIAHASRGWDRFEGMSHAAVLERGLEGLIAPDHWTNFLSMLTRARTRPQEDHSVCTELANRSRTCVEWVLSVDQRGEVHATAQVCDPHMIRTGLGAGVLLDGLLSMQREVITVLNPDTSVRFMSDAIEPLLGITAEESYQIVLNELVHPEDLKTSTSILETIAAHHPSEPAVVFEYRMRHARGHWIHVATVGRMIFHGSELRGFLLLTRERTLPPEVSEPHEEGLRLDALDPRVTILSLDEARARAKDDEPFADTLDYILREDSPRCIYGPTPPQMMFSLDANHVVVLTLPPYETPSIEVPGESLLQVFDHELRTPINNIRGYTELLIEEMEGTPMMQRDLRKVHASTRSLQRLLDNLVELMRSRRGDLDLHMEQLAIEELFDALREHLGLMLDDRGVELTLHVQDGAESVYTDRERLLDALAQLIAFLAPRSTALSLSVTRARSGEDEVWFELEAREYKGSKEALEVALEEELQFDDSPVRREHLDVYVSARRFELLGGNLHLVYREEHEDPLLCGHLPLPTNRHEEHSLGLDDEYESEVTGEGPVILLIDADEGLHTRMGRWLVETNYHLEHAYDGVLGLKIAREVIPTLIILDVVVPRLDGWSVLTALRREITLRDVPVLIHSVIADDELAHALGATELLSKPADRSALLDAIDRLHELTESGEA